MVLIIGFLLNRTVWGRRVYAIGSNKEAARSSGIPVRMTLWSVYILAGLLVGLGGWMFLARFASGTSTAGNLLELEAIAAVVIGGARLAGGYGKVFGTVVGTIIFAVIANLLSLLNVSTFLQDAFRGALILVAVGAGHRPVHPSAQGEPAKARPSETPGAGVACWRRPAARSPWRRCRAAGRSIPPPLRPRARPVGCSRACPT